jgi:gliding motility-associated-like protein
MSDPTLTNITATPSVNTMYYLEGIDAIGCTGKDSALVTVINTCLNVRNAFTPNGDGINDLWKVYDRRDCIADKLKVTVFNRYGSKVYESQDYWNSWNGSYKGSPLPDGTYYAVVEFFLPNKQRVVRKSDVNIIR